MPRESLSTRVGGQLVSFLLDHHGLQGVRQIFLESHFDDPCLAEHIEEVIGESIDSLEQQITCATKGRHC